ncbi:MAG: hypothetical protein IJU77_00525 [Butyrivibrio sp.]|nr:hypothetical protein [Butyrivibrio sp.]
MDKLKKWIQDYFKQPDFMKRFVIMMVGVFFLGFWLSFLIRANYGTDPCTFMNLTVSRKLGILFGTWQLILNAVLFVLVILFGRNYIGFGTLANMVLIGYIADFFGWIWDNTIPQSFFTNTPTRILTFVVSFSFFVVSASLYMNANMGVAPYDAVPLMIKRYIFKKAPFAIIRICFDYSVVLIGVLCGGKPNIGILLMALFLGPVIQAVGKFLNKHV